MVARRELILTWMMTAFFAAGIGSLTDPAQRLMLISITTLTLSLAISLSFAKRLPWVGRVCSYGMMASGVLFVYGFFSLSG